MPRAKAQITEADPEVEKAEARAPSASPRRSRASRGSVKESQANRGAAAAVAEPEAAKITSDKPAVWSRRDDAGTDVEIAGRPESPPAARRWDAPPASPPAWSYPSGTIAGRDTPKSQPLAAPLVPSLGPEGRRRRPIAVVALSIITLGIYALLWHSRINTEVGDFDTRMYVRSGQSTFAVVVAWAIGLLISVAGAVLVVSAQMQVTLPFNPQLSSLQTYLLLGGIVAVPYVVMLVPFSIVAVVMTLERVRIAEDRAGRTTDVQLRPARVVCWLLVPVFGGLVLIGLMQRRLNRVWEIVAPGPVARITNY